MNGISDEAGNGHYRPWSERPVWPASLRVRALRRGFYGNLLRRPGDVFVIARADFAAGWMKRVSSDTPERRTTAQQALDAEHDRRSPLGRARRVARSVEDDEPAVIFAFDPFNFNP